jgi:hypothetical protein
MIQSRYLTASVNSQIDLKDSLYALMNDLNAVYDEEEGIRVNPLSGDSELEAVINQNFEFILKIHWKGEGGSPTLVTFDVELATPVEPYWLNEALAIPAEVYFPSLVLVYNSYGRARSIKLFPFLLDLENTIRELIIAVMFTRFGPCWWDEIIVRNNLNRAGDSTAEQSRSMETEGKLHNSFAMHPLYYLELKALREIMESVDELVEVEVRKSMPDPTNLSRTKRRKWEQDLTVQLPFSSILENYDNVSMTDKISEIRELRNRLMHGRYLTERNEQQISVICEQMHRFLVSPSHVGDFRDRNLIIR